MAGSIRVNGLIRDSLKSGRSIAVYALADNNLLRYGEFELSLAAGLEASLINKLDPEWNEQGKKAKKT